MMASKVFVKHKGGGSLVYSMGGTMHKLEAGAFGYVPENLAVLHTDKLEIVPEEFAVVHETAILNKAKASLRRSWPLKMAPADYLVRFGDHGKHSELARELVENG